MNSTSPLSCAPTGAGLTSSLTYTGTEPDSQQQVSLDTATSPVSVPFTLSLQEDKSNPGQFQLVMNLNRSTSVKSASWEPNSPAESAQGAQGLLFSSRDNAKGGAIKSSGGPDPPIDVRKRVLSQMVDGNLREWSDLDQLPTPFLQKVLPEEWQRPKEAQPNRLADIKARIKKSGKGFVVRLLKGSAGERDGGSDDEVAEVQLQEQTPKLELVPEKAPYFELDSAPVVELDATLIDVPTLDSSSLHQDDDQSLERTPIASPVEGHRSFWNAHPDSANLNPGLIHEIGTSRGEEDHQHSAEDHQPEWLSDAETLTHDVSSINQVSRHSRSFSFSRDIPSYNSPHRLGLSVIGTTQILRRNQASMRGVRKLGPRRLPRPVSISTAPDSTAAEDSATESVVSPPRKTPRRRGVGLVDTGPGPSPVDVEASTDEDVFHPSGSASGSELKTFNEQPVGQQVSFDERQPPSSPKELPKIQTNFERRRGPSEHNSPTNLRRRANRTVSASHSPNTASDLADASKLKTALESALPKPGSVAQQSLGSVALPPTFAVRSSPSHVMMGKKRRFFGLALSALASELTKGALWIKERYGAEPEVLEGHVRVRWTCHCGEPLYDDFVENRPGAARFLEAYLNRPRAHTGSSHSPSSSSCSSPSSSQVFSNDPTPSSTFTSVSSLGGSNTNPFRSSNKDYSPVRTRTASSQFPSRGFPYPDPQWLLICANEGRYTPKVVHLDVNNHRIRSDKDLAVTLRGHYDSLDQKWFRFLKLRGLVTINFAQFEVHVNRFADIRKCPDMPPHPSEEYSFEPNDLVPPVGSKYLLHLFKHPADYDGELVTYLRAPKRRERLPGGQGWGLVLVEGFLADRVWTLTVALFAVGSLVFAIVWVLARKNDVQGAFGVAAWMVTLAVLAVGWAQACLE